ncbi:TetR/AcrR family transcriptional regulator [Roseateles sp. BYS87W]|jgi:AcrR family transcriptional regulator|uniref:TetR/AcrR family transcriptional regulator n=1 Tax=Pelomonas baiyunensis TaxID=3299026 RepID=A0ABW7GSW1_9BURK
MQTRLPTEERQAEIVEAALRLASESSPALITTGDIAAAIGVTQGAVFKHFPTKDAIWLAAMRWVRETLLLQNLQAAADQSATPLDALAAMFRAHVEFVIAHPGVPRFIFHELQQPADSAAKLEVRGVLQGYRKLLLGQLAQSIEQRQVSADLDPEAAATSFIGLIQGLVMQSMLTGKPAAMRQQANAIFTLYRRGLGEAR